MEKKKETLRKMKQYMLHVGSPLFKFSGIKLAKDMGISQQSHFPVIKEVFDTVTLRRDGTITPCSPILITGENLLYWPKEQVEFCIYAVGNPLQLIPVTLYRYTNRHILITLPDLEKGKYRPVLRITQEEKEEQKYDFSVTWQIRKYTIIDIYNRTKVRHDAL